MLLRRIGARGQGSALRVDDAGESAVEGLVWIELRQDPRVTVLEQTSARVLTPEQIDAPCTWVVCDASFISLRKVLEVPLKLAAQQCQLVALIKPQFEVGRDEVGKGGVVRDPVLHERVCGEVRDWLEGEGWAIQGIVESPIKGPEGNIEFLVHILPKCRATHCVTEQEAAEVVRQAHESLGNA